MPEHKEIITLPIRYDVTEQHIKKLADLYSEFPTDMSAPDNYAIVKQGVASCRKLRGQVERRRKELKADALAYGKRVDAAAREIKEKLLAIETPMLEVKRAWDNRKEIERREAAQKEEKRINAISSRINYIKSLPGRNISGTVEDVKVALEELQTYPSPLEWADEFAQDAIKAIESSIIQLNDLLDLKIIQADKYRVQMQLDAEENKKSYEEAIDIMAPYCKSKKKAKELYDLIKDGKVPGIK